MGFDIRYHVRLEGKRQIHHFQVDLPLALHSCETPVVKIHLKEMNPMNLNWLPPGEGLNRFVTRALTNPMNHGLEQTSIFSVHVSPK